jgi:SAM-dependent methyltransferase
MSVFGHPYADQYDLLYQEKNYAQECDVIESAFCRHATLPVHTILDLGCGTGNHAIPLAKRGYEVHGVDLSPDMLARANAKAETESHGGAFAPPMLHQGDVRTMDLGQQFDAVLMMFAVLGYQRSNQDVLAALRTVRRHLKAGGVFVFDVWYGPAVLAQRPSDRVKVTHTPDGQLVRVASGALDTRHHLCEVRYHLWRLAGDRLVAESQESHPMRYFFPLELELALTQCGLLPASLTGFPSLDTPVSESTWNALVVAR